MPIARPLICCAALILIAGAGNAAPTTETSGAAISSARGNEPGWSMQITGAEIRLVLDYGERQIEVKLPPAEDIDGATVYRLPDEDITVTIIAQGCTDDMTGMPYPATVRLDIGDRELRGCGGEPRALLEGPEWQISSLGGEPLPESVSVTIQFLEDDRVAGTSGCNRFMGAYELTGEGLSFGQLAGTMMACPPPQMDVERRFLELMGEVIGFDRPDDGSLVLATSSGQRINAKPKR